MDGETALWYARSRLSTSDFDRNRRAQEVVYAIFNRLLSLNALVRAPELYQQFRDAVETDMTLEDVLPFVPLAPLLSKPESIRRYTIGPGQVYDYVAEGGAWVLWPDQNAIMEIIIEAVYMP
jgi:anionic cell wall polymer biosynthesis LytR-Cps2A-Psr (LCP) family protein